MKRLIFATLLALLSCLAWAGFDPDTELSSYRGVIETRGSQTWLLDDSGDGLRLLLAPRSLLDSLGLHLAEGDTVAVEGWRDNELFLVGRLWCGADDSNPWLLRNLDEASLETGGVSDYRVNGGKCIGCKLCVSRCPTGAITMVNRKAQIDPELCTECGICIEGYGKFRGCQVGAIEKE